MLLSIYRDALTCIHKAEHQMTFEPASVIEEAGRMTSLLQEQLLRMKSHVLEKGFSDNVEEINFFKNIKPQLLGKLIFYNKVFRIESSCPVPGGKLYRKYFSSEMQHLNEEYREHTCNSEFYRYYRLGRTDWDHAFFLLGKIDLNSGVSSFMFEIDAQFSTLYDYKVSKIISSELLYGYLQSRISGADAPLFTPDGTEGQKDLIWTDSKNALIELIYALHASGCISNGKVGIRRISAVFQMLFRVKLGDVHHAFHRMKGRADSRSLFLDQLRSSLRQHMEQEL